MSVNESILVELNETQTRTLTLCPTPAFVRALTTELKPGLGSLESKGVALQFDFFQFYFFSQEKPVQEEHTRYLKRFMLSVWLGVHLY